MLSAKTLPLRPENTAYKEALIVAFAPHWNGHDGQRLLTEEAEREATEEAGSAKETDSTERDKASLEDEQQVRENGSGGSFEIRLRTAYYHQGLINPGAEASHLLGDHGDPVIVYLGNKSEQVDSLINRTANANGSVRVVGNNAEVLDPQHILLFPPVNATNGRA